MEEECKNFKKNHLKLSKKWKMWKIFVVNYTTLLTEMAEVLN